MMSSKLKERTKATIEGNNEVYGLLTAIGLEDWRGASCSISSISSIGGGGRSGAVSSGGGGREGARERERERERERGREGERERGGEGRDIKRTGVTNILTLFGRRWSGWGRRRGRRRRIVMIIKN